MDARRVSARVPKGDTAFGLGLGIRENVTSLSGYLEYGVNNDSRVWFGGGVSFADDSSIESLGGDIPPSPGIGIGLATTNALGTTGLDYFLGASLAAEFARVVEGSTTLASIQAISLGTTIGISKRLPTQSETAFTPFFALTSTRTWMRIDSDFEDIDNPDSEAIMGGSIGLEIEISPTVVLSSAYTFSFENSDTVFSVGLRFLPTPSVKHAQATPTS
jgi:hypothetical protein